MFAWEFDQDYRLDRGGMVGRGKVRATDHSTEGVVACAQDGPSWQ